MKKKFALAFVLTGALAIPAGSAIAGNGDKATGGGKVLFSEDDVKASTIAFTAQGTVDSAKGQVQFIDRSAGGGQDAVKYHGVVDCIEVDGNRAIIGGFRKKGDPTDDDDRFVLRVIDNGEPNQGQDLIEFDDQSSAPDACGDEDEDTDPQFRLAHGNAQVRDGDSSNPESSSRTMSFTKALKLAGLRK